MRARQYILVAALCWHFLLTAVLLPVHWLLHSPNTDTRIAATTNVASGSASTADSHHSDDCQLCRLTNHLQPAFVDHSSAQFVPVTSLFTAATDHAIVETFSHHYSGRAPPRAFCLSLTEV